jgi:NDP-sugar pyrophosphorylase family protein
VEKHFSEKAAATLAVSPNYQLPVGVVEINDGRVTAMREKPSIPINVTIGILTLEAHHITENPEAKDIMADLIPQLIQRGEKISAYISNAFWYDVGTTERYEKLTNEIIDKHLSTILEKTRRR